ncbi:MAG: hypothetical protein NUV70_09160 [Caldiserica bacterium]|nr:hypothetical protein [Caldisericota bacterium]
MEKKAALSGANLAQVNPLGVPEGKTLTRESWRGTKSPGKATLPGREGHGDALLQAVPIP